MLKHILIIEDDSTQEFLVRKVVRERGFKPVVLVSLRHALEFLDEYKGKDGLGVMTDLYFPADYDSLTGTNSAEGYVMQPLGALVMAECKARGIPCVIVTAGHHHGQKYNEICVASHLLKWPMMIDSATSIDGESPHKNWEEGLSQLCKIFEVSIYHSPRRIRARPH